MQNDDCPTTQKERKMFRNIFHLSFIEAYKQMTNSFTTYLIKISQITSQA